MRKSPYLLLILLLSCEQKNSLKEKVLAESTEAKQTESTSEVVNVAQAQKEETKLSQDTAYVNQLRVEGPQSDTWTIDKIEKSKFIFKEGPAFETGLFEVEYIGQIDIDKKAPYLIYSGRDCSECDANIAIYFHSPRNEKLAVGSGKNSFSYPGIEKDYLTGLPVYQARAFYGEVLDGVQGIVWYQKSRQEDNSFYSSVFIAKIEESSIKEETIKGFDNHLQKTLSLNKAGKNKEIKGREYISQP